jgi:hypothetical protein
MTTLTIGLHLDISSILPNRIYPRKLIARSRIRCAASRARSRSDNVPMDTNFATGRPRRGDDDFLAALGPGEQFGKLVLRFKCPDLGHGAPSS